MSVPSAPSGQIPEKEEKHSSGVLLVAKNGGEESGSRHFINLPKVLKLSVQVEVAHSTLRTVSMLVTCFPLDASPERVSTVV